MIKISTNSKSKGFFILTIANVLSKVLSLIYVPFLIATIGDEGYGIYYAAYNVYALVFTLTISGTSAVIPKLIAEYLAKDNISDAMASFKIGRRMLVCMGIIMSLSLFTLSNPIADFIGYPKAYLSILVLCPSVLLTSV